MEQERGTKDKIYAKGIKGFQKGLVCEPIPGNKKQYKENTVFEEPGGEICGPGVMHAAESAADVLDQRVPHVSHMSIGTQVPLARERH